jgi:hypothetical protein
MCRKLSVAYPDLHEYALILVGWIWIRIGKADPDAGGYKLPTKKDKSKEMSCFEALDLF